MRFIVCLLLILGALPPVVANENPAFQWPEISSQHRPWTYWWWMGNAVDRKNISRELEDFAQAGLGGAHIIPIYGAKGYENQFIGYLTPQWMDMLEHSVSEAQKRGLGVDMTTGSGWCFGGPLVQDAEANASVVHRIIEVPAGGQLPGKIDKKLTQALTAFSPGSEPQNLMHLIGNDGQVKWSPSNGTWQVYAVSQKPSGQKVKRASPGGQGHMLNLIYPEAMHSYMDWFGRPFERYRGPKPRAQYHDSYEYRSDWAPDLFEAFEKHRGYNLQHELPALFGNAEPDRSARVKCDYRETVSDVMIEESMPLWAKWSKEHGFLTRNEAHGAPGNWLDLYALSDIPETEMFHTDRNKLISKFASSAAHVSGKKLVSSETGTWLREHFTETLADMKYLLDDLFLSGVNHIFYHGTCYSPDEADWPGWLFYASYQMNPRNPVWHDTAALNLYAARCQSILQAGSPDHDILLYWPLHDLWHNPSGMVRNLNVHSRDWFEEKPIGRCASNLWAHGFGFDYVSDRQLAKCQAGGDRIKAPGGEYRLIVVPRVNVIRFETFQNLLQLANSGATVLFEKELPGDVSGWAQLAEKRQTFEKLKSGIGLQPQGDLQVARVGSGSVVVGELEPALKHLGTPRETMFDLGLMSLRRSLDENTWHYFIANRSETNHFAGWVPLARGSSNVVILDPLSGKTGLAQVNSTNGSHQVRLVLPPGASAILRCVAGDQLQGELFPYFEPTGDAVALTNSWQVRFIKGGPALPAEQELETPRPWSELPDGEAFSGTAIYSTSFDAPGDSKEPWAVDLGEIAQSARVRVNGKEIGVLITPPYRLVLQDLKPRDNLLEVEVTSTAANRIRDLDKRGVPWKKFHDINFVNINYKPFDASSWPVTASGLIGPVCLVPVTKLK